MDNKNQLTPLERAVRVCVVMYAISVVTVLFAIFRMDDGITKIIAIAASVVMAGFATLLLASMLYMEYAMKHKKNYFLYDRKTKGNLPMDALSFKFIREKVVDYMSLFKRGKKLYVGELFTDTPWSMEAMKPLLCYELLYELSEEKNVESCEIFLGYGAECSKLLSRFLMESSDYELCERINDFFLKFEGEPKTAAEFMAYIADKKQHIEAKMLEYTRKNIDKFIL